jgi:hypothetical protein
MELLNGTENRIKGLDKNVWGYCINMFSNFFSKEGSKSDDTELNPLKDANKKFALETDKYIKEDCKDPKDANLALENVMKQIIIIDPTNPYNSYKLKQSNRANYDDELNKYNSKKTQFKEGYKKCEEKRKEKYIKDGYVLVIISDPNEFNKEIDYYYQSKDGYKKLGKFTDYKDGIYFFTDDETQKIVKIGNEFENFLIKNPDLVDPNSIELNMVDPTLVPPPLVTPTSGGNPKKTRRRKNKKRLAKRRSSKK